MSARLDQACSWCPVQAWCCSSLLSRVPVPIPCQQPDFGLAPVATHDWSPAAAEVSHSPLVHHKHVHEERTTSHARVGASEAVTASPAVREPAKQQRRRPVLDRGQAGEGSRVRKNQWTSGPLEHQMPRGRVLLALLHGESAHAPTMPNDPLVETILATIKQSLNITDIRKKVVCNTMGKAEDTALIASLGFARQDVDSLDWTKICKRDWLRWCYKLKRPQGMGLTWEEQALVRKFLLARQQVESFRYSPGTSSTP